MFLSSFDDTLLGVIEKEPQSGLAFQNSSLFPSWWQRWKNLTPQLMQSSNGSWTVGLTLSVAEGAKEFVFLQSPGLQPPGGMKSRPT